MLYLLHHKAASRVDLANALSLTKAGISVLVSEMLDNELIVETGILNTTSIGVGKKKIAIDINAKKGLTIGCFINEEFIFGGLADLRGNVHYMCEPIPIVKREQEIILSTLIECIEEISEQAQDANILGIGIACNPNIQDVLQNFKALQKYVSQKTNLPVAVSGSPKALGTAQMDFSLNVPDDYFLFVEIDSSMNVALFLNGEIYAGGHGKAGSLNHMVIDPNGPVCECGRKGCLNTIVSTEYVMQQVRDNFSKEKFPVLYDLLCGNIDQLNYTALMLASSKGDKGARELEDNADERFLQVLLNLVSVLDPKHCYLYGLTLFENDFIDKSNKTALELLGNDYKDVFSACSFKRSQVFLSGCAIAGRKFFFQKEAEH